ncbi:EAL domain-containing protein [Ectothiorhodospiraceae bacterium WFHF3C12]|nr:EAL domain-containing protein [Ectothiorhodospiraceae bacterium WFHF3C12]
MTAKIAQQVRSEQTRQLYDGFPLTCVISVAVAMLLAATQATTMQGPMPAIWLGLVLGAYGARTLMYRSYQQRADRQRGDSVWLGRYQIAVILTGLAWGSAAFLIFPPDNLPHQLIVSVILAGVAASGVTTLAPVWTAAAIFIIPVLTPLMLRYAWFEPSVALPMVPAWGLFLLLLLLTGRRIHATNLANIRLRLEMAVRQTALRESEELYRLIFKQAPLGILHFDADGNIIDCNEKFVEIIGSSRDRLLGLNMVNDLRDDAMKQAVRDALSTGWGYYEGTYESVTADKATPVRVFFNGIRDDVGEITGGVGVVEDFTERQRAEALVERHAYYDALTELPNRRLLLDRLEQALSRCRRHGHSGALLFLDLDHFKRINDSLGHGVGDEILRGVAQRLGQALREEDTAARLSGDEFVVLLPELGDRSEEAMAQAQGFAGRVQKILESPYEIHGFRLQVTPSIGLALFPGDADTAQDILRHADAAMYRAKAEGRATYRFYLPSMQDEADERLALESDLRRALDRRELSLNFQPLVDRNQYLVGAEALVRWFHPVRGSVKPTDFIPLSEQTGLILNIGEWVLREACLAIAELGAETPDGTLPRISVNVSPAQFRQADFVERVRQTLDAAGVPGNALTLELTEGVLIEDLAEATAKMHALKKLGVRFAVDDFGRGYSSLTYLKRLPVDVLKVDQDFVRDITVDSNDAAMVDTILTMARHLGLSSVAEGVETPEQLAFLMDRGCEIFQGFYFSEPLSQAAFARYLRASTPPSATAAGD